MSSSSSSSSDSIKLSTNSPVEMKLQAIIQASRMNNWLIKSIWTRHPDVRWMLTDMSIYYHKMMENEPTEVVPDLSLGFYSTFEESLKEKKAHKAKTIRTIYYKLNLIRISPEENLAEIAEALLLIAQNKCVNPYEENNSKIDKFLSMFTF